MLRRFADELERRQTEMTKRVSLQNGMPVAVAVHTEGYYPAKLLHYYADLITRQPAEEVRNSLMRGITTVRREPVGVVAAIVPWNFPQTLSFFKVAPALASGSTVVLKPAPETVLDALLMAEAAEAAELPPGVLNIVTGTGEEVGAHLVKHPGVDKVAFTGSTAAGRIIAAECGQLLRPVTLELGGKSAGIVLDDVNLGAVTKRFFEATLLNQGQTCFISTRILAPASRYSEIAEVFTSLAASLRIGDPLDPRTLIGPLATAKQRATVERYIELGKAEGGRVATGGARPEHLPKGWYIEPTVFTDVDNNSALAQEEIFGPVLSIIKYSDVDEAVHLANSSSYGLGGTVWTSDPERGLDVARRIRTGSVGVNGFTLDIGAPFGGIKSSGLGRELGPEGLDAYQQIKSIYLPEGL